MQKDIEVVIIGAGLAGLTAARVLKSHNRRILLIDAADDVGGRVRTDMVDGFLLDRGFQVFLTAYPEAQRFLDYKALNLRPFKPGAFILKEHGISQIGDPLRNPSMLLKTLMAPVGSLADKIKMLKTKLDLSGANVSNIFERPETTTADYLSKAGFSEKMINSFFKPFFSGIFLEPGLQTSSRMFEFVFKMMGEGDTVVPAKGMSAIPYQLADILSPNELLLNEKVMKITDGEVLTFSGRSFKPKAILIATEQSQMPAPFNRGDVKQHSVTNIYFSADRAPFTQPMVALNSCESKLVNNIAVMSNVSASYAPKGKALISVSLVGDLHRSSSPELILRVQNELKKWCPDAATWTHLKTYHIPYALPDDDHVQNDINSKKLTLAPNVYVCGDHLLNGSINAAMKSGRLAAELICHDII